MHVRNRSVLDDFGGALGARSCPHSAPGSYRLNVTLEGVGRTEGLCRMELEKQRYLHALALGLNLGGVNSLYFAFEARNIAFMIARQLAERDAKKEDAKGITIRLRVLHL